eukprot:Platyproteum_vivax@DN2626_c0_g1_i1.p1
MVRVRLDGRKQNELRPASLSFGSLKRLDGSARFGLGYTVVQGAVLGPVEAKYSRKELFDDAFVEVIIKPPSGIASPQDRSLEFSIQKILKDTIDSKKFPRTTISIYLKVLADDGALEACCINAAVLACIAGCVPLRCTPLAIPLLLTKHAADGLTILLDGNLREEATAASRLTLTLDSLHSNKVVAISSEGHPVAADAWPFVVQAGAAACKELRSHVLTTFQNYLLPEPVDSESVSDEHDEAVETAN